MEEHDEQRARALVEYRKQLLAAREMEAKCVPRCRRSHARTRCAHARSLLCGRLKAKREQLKDGNAKYEKSEDDLKALQVRHTVAARPRNHRALVAHRPPPPPPPRRAWAR